MHENKRILQLIVGLGVGGAETALFRSSRELVKRGYEVRVLCIKRLTDLASEFADQEIRVSYLGDLLKEPGQLFELRAWSADILVAWMPHSHILSLGLRRILGAKSLVWNVRQTLNILDVIPWKTKNLILLGSKLSRSADAIIYNSQRGMDDHKALGYSSRQEVVIPNGFAIPGLRTEDEKYEIKTGLPIPLRTPVISFVGRNHPDKGVPYFLEAAETFLQTDQAEFIIAGNGFEELKAKYAHHPLGRHFHFLGTLNEAKLARVYAITDIFTSSSISEGFSNAIGEAMSYANFPVVTDVGDSAKIVADTGRVVPEKNSERIVSAWREFLSLPVDEQNRKKLAARERIERNFSLARSVTMYDELFKNLLSR